MSGRRLFAVLVAVLLAAVQPVSADWWEMWQADGELDLQTARTMALTAMVNDPSSAEAVAAASWWLDNIENLADPEEPLSVENVGRDPELGFVLQKIDARLRTAAPSGSLTPAEVAGAFGVFSTLDLERDVVPVNGELPSLGTRWKNETEPFRLSMRTPDAYYGPPLVMINDGVYLVAWNLEVTEEASGWLVVEADGGFNLEVDGRRVDRRRECGVVDPATNWYRVRFEAGFHRVRVELASPNGPQVRVSLLDDRGGALAGIAVVETKGEELAASEVKPGLPPASRALYDRLENDEPTIAELLLAASLAEARGDTEESFRWIEDARKLDPDDPWAAFALSRHLFPDHRRAGSGEAARVSQLLRSANSIAGSRLFARALAIREGRGEDAEKILDSLMDDGENDVRVLRIRVRDSVRRGWAREAEESLARLESALPDSESVTGLRLEVLAALERWDERDQLLQALAVATPVGMRWVSQLASSCLAVEALAAAGAFGAALADPDLDVQFVRLALEIGDLDSAAAALERARETWGDLGVLDQLALLLAGGDREAVDRALSGALGRHPSNLQLLTLAWRLGAEPFYSEFVLDARDFATSHRDLGKDVDVVLLLDQAVERIFPDGSSLYYYHGVTRANTPVGVRRASMLQPLADAHFLKVRILKPDGSVVVPDEIRAGNGVMTVSGVEPGDLVEEEYVAEVAATGASRNGHLPPYIYRFADPDRAFGLSQYVLLVPREVDLQVDGNFEGLVKSETEWRGLRMLNWRAEMVPPMVSEPFAPPAQELMPWLNYGFGVSWQDVGDAVRDRVLPVLRTSPDLRKWSRPLLAGEDAEANLQALVDALFETVESGGAELSVGSSAAQSFADRRGNRLGILAAVLAEAGWTVDMVLTRAWNERGQRLDVPTLDAFPVALLRVQGGDRELWVDIREERRGVNHINPLFQGADGLVLPLTDPGRPVYLLDRLPSFANPDLLEEVSVRARVFENGDARVTFRMSLPGNQAEQLLQQVESVPADQVGMIYRQIAAGIFAGADEVKGEIERMDSGALIQLDLTAPGACELQNGGMVCRSLVLSNPMVPVLASLPKREYALVLRVPVERRLELEVEPPPGWALADRRPRRLEAEWGTVGETVEKADGTEHSVLRITLPAQTVAPEAYPEFARFCQAVDELTMRPPRLNKIVP